MNPQLEAAWEIGQFLTQHDVTYAIIGLVSDLIAANRRLIEDILLRIRRMELPKKKE